MIVATANLYAVVRPGGIELYRFGRAGPAGRWAWDGRRMVDPWTGRCIASGPFAAEIEQLNERIRRAVS